VIEGESLRHATRDDEVSDDSSSDQEDDDGNAAPPGKTYRVGGGKLKLQEKGMAQYVAFVERKLARKQREAKT
jgi:ATP-binding cassette subfamily F protein 3